MEIIVESQWGRSKYTMKLEEKSVKETLNMAITLGNPPHYCHACKNIDSNKFSPDTNRDKDGNIYINTKCELCGAKSGLGTYKTGGFFWKKFEKYVPQGTTQSPEPKKWEEEE